MSDDFTTAVKPATRNAALTELFLGYHRSLVGFALLLVDDLATAEDVVQDAFLSLHRRWTWMRDPGAAYAYLRTSVINGSRSQLRRRKVRSGRHEENPGHAPSAEAAALEHAAQDEVLHHLTMLPRRQRQVLVLRYYLDLSEAEIAGELSISAGSVKQHASRGLATLTARLAATS
jgi:RNA polymerase sigma-70 factor (sigma-E family)